MDKANDFYSCFSALTGFLLAALQLCKLTVNGPIPSVITAASAKIQQLCEYQSAHALYKPAGSAINHGRNQIYYHIFNYQLPAGYHMKLQPPNIKSVIMN